ncbi:MAG: MotA/TolQ/ExbB proton channel family protein [bacterium]|nr:MotA/TolQ/ExbB proton channel family protein [bacterium]
MYKLNHKYFPSTILIVFICMISSSLVYANEAVGQANRKDSLFSLLIKGGPVMIPLLICSIIALAIIIERFVSLRKEKIIPGAFMNNILIKLGNFDTKNLEASKEFCIENNSPVARVIKAGINRCRTGRSVAEIEEVLEDIGGREIRKLKGSLQGLKIIAAISPLLGLLGTVYGMITSFQSVAYAAVGVARAETLALGIYEAMVTTASGLTIAIPVLLIFYYLNYLIDKQLFEIEFICDEFLEKLVISKSNNKNK